MPTCEERIEGEYQRTMEHLRILYNNPEGTEDLGTLADYFLGIDFVEPFVFVDQPIPFHRMQMSWGGPQDEFRIYPDDTVKYWFLDWWDGASKIVKNDDKLLVLSIFDILKGEKRW